LLLKKLNTNQNRNSTKTNGNLNLLSKSDKRVKNISQLLNARITIPHDPTKFENLIGKKSIKQNVATNTITL